jgi:hypothetical protein
MSKEKLLDKIPEVAIPNDIKKVFSVITYKRDKPEVFGSSALKSQYFSVDYDLFSKIYETADINKARQELYRTFLNMFENIRELDDIYLMDMKAGIDEDLFVERERFKNPSFIKNFYQNQYKLGNITKKNYETIVDLASKNDKDTLYEFCRLLWTLRWSFNDMKLGYKMLQGNRKKTFQDAIDDKTIVKIDIVAYVEDKFIEFSNLFEIYVGDKSINIAKLRIIDSIKQDIYDYYLDHNWFKMLKRIFVIAKLRKDLKLVETLTHFFNSDAGLVYKVRGDIQTLFDLLDKGYDDKNTVSKIKNELQPLKGELSKVYEFKIPDTIYGTMDSMTNERNINNLKNELENTSDLLLDIVNKQALSYIKRSKINYKSYLPSIENRL